MFRRVIGFGLFFTVALFLYGGILSVAFGTDDFSSVKSFRTFKQSDNSPVKRKSVNPTDEIGSLEQSKFLDKGFGFSHISNGITLKRQFAEDHPANSKQFHSTYFQNPSGRAPPLLFAGHRSI